VFCRVVSPAEHPTFLAGEGLVHATLANTEQHPNLPRVLATAGHAVAGGVLAFQPCFGNLHTLVRQVRKKKKEKKERKRKKAAKVNLAFSFFSFFFCL
jgi:hypothetical protein